MLNEKQKLGKYGESLATVFLKKRGYKILARNFRAKKFGEIDIIAKEKKQIVFIEVKTKSSYHFGYPEEEFNYFKRKKLMKAINFWFLKQRSKEIEEIFRQRNWRLDLITVDFSENSKKPKLKHYIGV